MFKPIKPNVFIDNKIARKIIEWEWQWYFKPIFDVLKPNEVLNDNNIIFEALKTGALYYQNGGFYSKTGRFSNAIARELEKIGARYSKYARSYRLAKNKIPQNLLWVIETTNAKVYSDVVVIKKILDVAIGNIDEAIKGLKLVDLAEEMILNVEKRVYENFKANKIETITPKMTDFRAREFAKNYTENLKFYIKDREPKEIIKMREVVGQMAIEGESRVTIANYIKQRFGVEQRYAKFLARNESHIAVTEYLSAKYQEEGFTHFKWITNFDGRERELHKELGQERNNKYGINGTNVFRFDNPPVIYEDKKRGIVQKGLPGETYNCRCTFVPIMSKTQLIDRKITKEGVKV